MKTRIFIVLNAVIFFAIANFFIFQKEKILKEGDTVILALAPLDPRSLIQGDYLEIRYAIFSQFKSKNGFSDGYIFVKKDDRGIFQFSKITDLNGRAEAAEIKIRFRERSYSVRIGAESYLFQEGEAQKYEKAKYGMLKISGEGEAMLIALLDEKLKLIQ
ncbi:MAG: GDYXXLXY domain-containing protein [Leptospiraceae bacterium]|nr:GDYXXLXY domain-containing protein [Leptospiraceae bacterium]MCK6380219.1 GDYXXLXY domain-containing protein [Leptospiraceae bacterium]NUM41327.1 GDYXXLXY domain-containing protein [Leptospiraceae bacterium]